ncbi:MAG: sigma-70 family RNA polymerase sigma factor [Planctomycetes bacterium]|nr:sigma-70 family RNA polymerase sigma factor [Planctomycetota bacterium]
MSDITQILTALEAGDVTAASKLLPLVYEELRNLAEQRMAREAPGQTLQPTALVHEAYLRVVGPDGDSSWSGRAHFLAAAAEAMRRILIERARAKQRIKRGGGRHRLDVDPEQLTLDPVPDEILALDEALEHFAAIDPIKARLVELRYFAGLGQEEAARVLEISKATADRYWAFARAWLYDALDDS